ncbi:MAG: hypothetical protein RL094_261 [Candidatus Parcubacteria bacterium]|jgi:phosphoribosylformylglycinamidine cyclo-ligase
MGLPKKKKKLKQPRGSEMTYKDSGVDYGALDPLKIVCQNLAAQTRNNIGDTDVFELASTRGESYYALELPDRYLVTVTEGLGTRNRVAEIAGELTGNAQYYFNMGYSNAATAFNDLTTSGGRILTFSLHIATGSAAWMKNPRFMEAFAQGTKKACDDARCTWGGGETSTLRDIVLPNTAVLGGSAFGQVVDKSSLVDSSRVSAGDAIILVASSGIHDNGITLTRDLPTRLRHGYNTRVKGGGRFFEELLIPTTIYAKMIYALRKGNIPLHYVMNITGHGWRKLMRAPQPFTYRIKKLLPVPPIFPFIQHHGNIAAPEMWGNYNMGAGYAVVVPHKKLTAALSIIKKAGYQAIHAGDVEEGKKQVLLEPIGVEYEAGSLSIR